MGTALSQTPMFSMLLFFLFCFFSTEMEDMGSWERRATCSFLRGIWGLWKAKVRQKQEKSHSVALFNDLFSFQVSSYPVGGSLQKCVVKFSDVYHAVGNHDMGVGKSYSTITGFRRVAQQYLWLLHLFF